MMHDWIYGLLAVFALLTVFNLGFVAGAWWTSRRRASPLAEDVTQSLLAARRALLKNRVLVALANRSGGDDELTMEEAARIWGANRPPNVNN